MEQSVGVGVIGDFDPQCVSHVATNAALHHAAATLNLTLNVRWVPTPELD
jgi:CTP synthase (UTP-ammonia lyase)